MSTELGWRSCTGERGSCRYRMPYLLCDLSVKDRRTADYVTSRVSGLPFDARSTEGASASDGAPGVLLPCRGSTELRQWA